MADVSLIYAIVIGVFAFLTIVLFTVRSKYSKLGIRRDAYTNGR